MKKIVLLIAMFGLYITGHSENAKISGPDGKLELEFVLEGGKPSYNVKYENKQVIESSPLGFKSNIGDYSSDIRYVGVEEGSIDQRYELDRIKSNYIHYLANRLKVNLRTSRGQEFSILFQVSDNDIAFR